MPKTLTVSNDTSKETLLLTPKVANSLELQLNLSIYGKQFSTLGDTLYDFSVNKEVPSPYMITKEQFELLKSFDFTF